MYVIEIQLTKGMVAIVGPEDADLALLKWSATNNPGKRDGKPKFYAVRQSKCIRIYLHREVLARKLGRKVRSDRVAEHGPDTDSLNCMRENLTECGQAENIRRMHKRRRLGLE